MTIEPTNVSEGLEQRARELLEAEYRRDDHARNFNQAGLYSSILHKRLGRLARRDQIALRAIMAALSPPLPSPGVEPVAWRWRHLYAKGPGSWVVRQSRIEPCSPTSHSVGVEVEPLYALSALPLDGGNKNAHSG